MNIILCGFKNCGKTTLGKSLARVLKRDFVDTDRLLEQLYYKKHNEQLPAFKIYKKVGEDRFRLLERKTLLDLSKLKNTIIATGGGIVLEPRNILLLKKIGIIVYLKATKKTIKERMFNSKRLPAFLKQKNPLKAFNDMFSIRKDIYEGIADLIVKVDRLDRTQIVAQIITSFREKYGK